MISKEKVMYLVVFRCRKFARIKTQQSTDLKKNKSREDS